ncbi:MAG: hypothetical protein WCT32_00735 [Patescibacteria group bacterium]|jgi:hypothetical protein
MGLQKIIEDLIKNRPSVAVGLISVIFGFIFALIIFPLGGLLVLFGLGLLLFSLLQSAKK